MRTNDELKEIALGIYRGEIFTSAQVPENQTSILPIIFMPLIGISIEDLKARDEVPHVVFAYTKDTLGGRGINGFPIFSTCEFLSKEEVDVVLQYHKDISKKIDEI